MKTLYIHIGTPKTGTTSIQNFCGLNRELLKEKGILYPLMPYHYERKNVNRNGFFLNGVIKENGVRKQEKEQEVFESQLDYIVECFNDNDTILLSDETIWWATAMRKKDLWKNLQEIAEKNNFQIKIIVYLRRQDQYMLSRYNQQIKTDYIASTKRFEDYFKDMNGRFKRVMDYYGRISDIAKYIPKENIFVKRFDRNFFYKGDLNSDFLHILGIEVDDTFTKLEEEANTGISVQSAEIKRVLNLKKTKSLSKNNKLIGVLKECEDVLPEDNTALMSTAEIKNFMEQFLEGNQKIVDEYIGDDKPLFDYTYKETVAWDFNDKNYNEELILFFIRIIEDIYKENRELKKELNINLKTEINKVNSRVSSINKNLNEKMKNEKSYSRETRYLLKHPIKSFYNKIKGAFRKK